MDVTLRSFTADDADWLIAQHAGHYTNVEGFDATFAPLVARIIKAFLTDHDPSREAGWIAIGDNKRLGSIFCVGVDDKTAKLRLFYTVPQARGRGVAQSLLSQCLQFARDAGYENLTLWTHESHVAAGRIYARNGFEKIDAKPVHSFGVDLVEETWQIWL